MQFESFADFIDMGGYGAYVWAVYGLTALVLVYNLVQPKLQRRQIVKSQRGLLLRSEAAAKVKEQGKS